MERADLTSRVCKGLGRALALGVVLLVGGGEAFVLAGRVAHSAALRPDCRRSAGSAVEALQLPSRHRAKRRETVTCLLDFRSFTEVPTEEIVYDKTSGKTVTFFASRSAEREVEEGNRPLRDYMALPPSQYSVLDEDAVVRISEDTFRCQINGINFFGYKLVPILFVKVLVDAEAGKSYLNVFKLELTGSRVAEIANGTFNVKARNVVAYRPVPERPGSAYMLSTVSVEVEALVPKTNVIPLRVLERGGSLIIQGVLNVMVPRFVKVLAKDYETWAAGDDSRAAVADEKLAEPVVE